jgi:hypothetical protein
MIGWLGNRGSQMCREGAVKQSQKASDKGELRMLTFYFTLVKKRKPTRIPGGREFGNSIIEVHRSSVFSAADSEDRSLERKEGLSASV